MAKLDPQLTGKVCVITGGSGLLGTAFVKACAENGAITIIADIRKPASIPAGAVFMKCDMTDPASVRAFIRAAVKRYGRIDALVNNAYPRNKNYGRKFEGISFKDFAENVSSHMGGYFAMTQAVAAVMKKQKGGSVVFMGSIYGFAAPRFEVYEGTAMTMPFEYSAIKGGILNMMRYLAAYLGPHGIRVNAISPGGVFNEQDRKFVKRYAAHVKLAPQRMASPEDIANGLIFLISDKASYITGHNLVIDAGWSL